MRIFKHLIIVATLAAATGATAQAAGEYDGDWSVRLVTERGACDRTYDWSVAVIDGRIADAGMFVQTAGAIDGRGRVRLQIKRGAQLVAASGRIAGQIGEGDWRSPTMQCSGAWTAARS